MNRFTVFGKEGCGFCIRAKQLLEDRKYPLKYIDIHKEGISKADLEKTIGRPVETVPQIFHGKEYIGGCQELEHYLTTLTEE
ncbi:MAG: GrxA family glutaredoxin [Proteobacteria bacterium]|nr:MAG: GrxA family glutaredoxin [Pseudomonadota bacterium]PIE40320.1 MAG: GrxA family glutaredoxin [Gammaproteobacteria bacterium]